MAGLLEGGAGGLWLAMAGWKCMALGHDEGKRSGGVVEDSGGKKLPQKKTQVGLNFNFLE